MKRSNRLARGRIRFAGVASVRGIACTALAISSGNVLAADFSWLPATGTFNYGDSANWSQPGEPAVPAIGDQAIFDNNFSGTVAVGAGLGASTLSFQNSSGALTFDLQGNPFSLEKVILLGAAADQVNDVTITGGGEITQTSSTAQSLFQVGFSGSHGNHLTVSGANTILRGRAAAATNGGLVGVAGSDNNVVTIRDGASLLQAADIIVGAVGAGASAGNEFNVLNGSTFAISSSPANALRGFQLINGTLNITNSIFNANRFNASLTDNNTTINFNSGTMITRASSILNGKVFTIGDGGALPATYFLAQGNATLLTSNGIVINSNGVLSGSASGTGGVGGDVSGVAGAKLSPYSLGGNLLASSDDNPISTLTIKGNLNHQNIETMLQLGDMSSAIVNSATQLPGDRVIVTAGSILGQLPTPAGTYNFDGGTFTHGGSIIIDLGLYKAPQDPGREIQVVSWSNPAGVPADTSVSFTGGSPLPYEFRSDGLYITLPEVVANSTWAVDADGNWGTAANWDGPIPYGIGSTANFGTALTAPRTVTANVNVSVGIMNFTQPVSYTIASGGTITMDAASGNAAINVSAGTHTIGAALTLNDDLSIDVAADSGLALTGVLTAAGRTIAKSGAGSVQFGNVLAAGLDISGGSVGISVKGSANDAAGTSIVQSLSIASGANLDLTNNSLIIDYTGAVGSLVNDIRQHLESGRLTTTAATPAGAKLGYLDNATLGTPLTTFAGQPVDTDSILIKFTYGGDANLDGKVDVGDLGALASNWQQPAPWTGGDFDYSGTVNVGDLGILATNWQQGVDVPLGPNSLREALAALGLAGVSVPEPSVLTLAALAAAAIGGRRRRNG